MCAHAYMYIPCSNAEHKMFNSMETRKKATNVFIVLCLLATNVLPSKIRRKS